jgi:hypothetical protein
LPMPIIMAFNNASSARSILFLNQFSKIKCYKEKAFKVIVITVIFHASTLRWLCIDHRNFSMYFTIIHIHFSKIGIG